jgi:hypothetical protein
MCDDLVLERTAHISISGSEVSKQGKIPDEGGGVGKESVLRVPLKRCLCMPADDTSSFKI